MSAVSIELDRIDQKILEVLSKEGRISYQQLAERVCLTPRPCQERVRKLERLGVIKGYQAVIVPPQMEAGVVLHLQVSMNTQHNRTTLTMFESMLDQHPAVLDAWLVGGAVDYLLRVRCKDMEAYRALSNQWLADERLAIERIICAPEMQVIKRSVNH